MGRLFGILIWTSLLVSMNGQVLFDDMGDRQRSADLTLHLMKTELQQFSQSVERIVMKKLADVEKNIGAKIDQMETKNNESFSTIQAEQRLLKQEIEGVENIIETKIKNIIQTQNNESLSTIQTEQRLLRQEMVSIATKVDTQLNKSETNLMKSEIVLDDIRNGSLYVVEQLSSGETIHMLKNVERISQFLLKVHYIAGSDCSDILEYNPNTQGKNGVYNITASSYISKPVYCDMTTDNEGWTVIQRRINGSVDFYRNWTEYKKGFGFADHEYWIGNDMLHRLTSLKPQELRVDMERFNGEKAYAVYSNFSVGNEASKYQLQVNGYSGTAGDSLAYHNNMKFTTLDQDNDGNSGGNCAITWRSAGWFNACYRANSNGQYTDSEKNGGEYILWYDWKNVYMSLKTIQLMIRHRA